MEHNRTGRCHNVEWRFYSCDPCDDKTAIRNHYSPMMRYHVEIHFNQSLGADAQYLRQNDVMLLIGENERTKFSQR